MTSSNKDTRLVKQYEANDRYCDRMKASGMKQIRVWVPCAEEHRVKTFAAGLRSAAQQVVHPEFL